ncbi:hypothetical protein CDL15_Pgr009403 [Punica granatum]|uniref:Uncharacterized protein n=1 Tax=Punica granatum TaxID=22663 RepID=A0A218VSK0_PUNGR|nr:hypothetical protein CDL15_Pgr009403 [Punica granatum]
MQPKRGKLSVPHFGPPASYMRIPDQSPGYYSSPDDQRRTCGHRDMNYRRKAGCTKKAEESRQKNRQTRNPKNSGAGNVALFIICQHPILAHRLPARGFLTEAWDTIHRPAIRGKYAGTGPGAVGEEHNPLRKTEESSQKNERIRNPEDSGAGTVALFITESLKHRKVPNMGLQKSLSLPK